MSPMTGRHADQDVFQTARSVRETSRRGLLAWAAWTRCIMAEHLARALLQEPCAVPKLARWL